MEAFTDFISALVLLLNFIVVPGLSYGSQLALGALGITLVFGILRFANFAHGDTMAFGTMIVVSKLDTSEQARADHDSFVVMHQA